MSVEYKLLEITVGVYPHKDTAKERWPVDKSATKDWDSSTNTITEACLTSLGYPIPLSGQQNLRWCFKARVFQSDFTVVARHDNATTELVVGEVACNDIKEAGERGAFPILPSKKTTGSTEEHKKEKTQQKIRQELEKAVERKEKLSAMRPASDARRDSGTG